MAVIDLHAGEVLDPDILFLHPGEAGPNKRIPHSGQAEGGDWASIDRAEIIQGTEVDQQVKAAQGDPIKPGAPAQNDKYKL